MTSASKATRVQSQVKSINWTQFSEFNLQAETTSTLRFVVFFIARRSIFLQPKEALLTSEAEKNEPISERSGNELGL